MALVGAGSAGENSKTSGRGLAVRNTSDTAGSEKTTIVSSFLATTLTLPLAGQHKSMEQDTSGMPIGLFKLHVTSLKWT